MIASMFGGIAYLIGHDLSPFSNTCTAYVLVLDLFQVFICMWILYSRYTLLRDCSGSAHCQSAFLPLLDQREKKTAGEEERERKRKRERE